MPSLFGGTGYSRETGIERLMRDAKGAGLRGPEPDPREIIAGEVLKRVAVQLIWAGSLRSAPADRALVSPSIRPVPAATRP